MYKVNVVNLDKDEWINCKKMHTIFLTKEWLGFLSKNQNVEPVILSLTNNNDELVAYFVGCVFRKLGLKMMGSPFEGWLTCDMGFIKLADFDYLNAVDEVAKFAISKLKCWYVQIHDKNIRKEDLIDSSRCEFKKLLYIDLSKSEDEILNAFSSHGRRDVRLSERKETEIKIVNFDREFVDEYYRQLIDVFAKQNLKPNYSIKKLYDLVDSLDEANVMAMKCIEPNSGVCIATAFSFGYGEWAYYMGAASYREYQKMCPNERIFWETLLYWKNRKIVNYDLVGYREYKMKYNPQVFDVPVFCYEKMPGLICAKRMFKRFVVFFRKLRGK